MIGRLLCWLGLHEWGLLSVHDNPLRFVWTQDLVYDWHLTYHCTRDCSAERRMRALVGLRHPAEMLPWKKLMTVEHEEPEREVGPE